MPEHKIRRALIAVYDKTGIAEFARSLVDEFGIEIISTGGTAKHLKEAGIPVTLVEEVTGFPEMLDGRVKTLHPKIHAAILADRDNPEHMRQLADQGIKPIDMVVVNLYPFEKTVADPNCKFEDAIEMIDIGGPCLLRAAAKNHKHVLVIERAESLGNTLSWLRGEFPGEISGCHETAAMRAFREVTRYDAEITRWLGQIEPEARKGIYRFIELFDWGSTRYGENPHQLGLLTKFWDRWFPLDLTTADVVEDEPAQQSVSFNNFVDADAALGLCAELTRAAESLWYRLLAGASESAHKAQLAPISEQRDSRRNLPHIQRPGATYFITFRIKSGELSTQDRDIIFDCCLFPDGKKVCLHAAVVMPDHVHLLMTPLEGTVDEFHQIGRILQSIKGISARRINEQRGGTGTVWLDENWDRIMRHEKEFRETLDYIIHNPITAGLPDAENYRWCVSEEDPGWIKIDRRAGVDLKHKLLRGAVRCEEVENPHRLIAGATKLEATPHRLITGARKQAAVVVFIKHTNACGVGIADDVQEAYCRAYLGDPNAAMGGILAVNFPVTTDFATAVMETYDRFGKATGAGGFFVEVWVAPWFDKEAVEIIRTKKKWGENVRLLAVGDMSAAPSDDELEYKTIAGGMLVQSRDLVGLNEDQWKVVTKRKPTESEMSDLRLAWLVAKHTKSNAISICKDGMLIGNGAGQMSRVMSCRIATWLAKENGHAEKLVGSVAASDAFFPFRDGPEILLDAGVTAIIQPGGSKRDAEVIAACDERGAAMIFTGTRHFKH